MHRRGSLDPGEGKDLIVHIDPAGGGEGFADGVGLDDRHVEEIEEQIVGGAAQTGMGRGGQGCRTEEQGLERASRPRGIGREGCARGKGAHDPRRGDKTIGGEKPGEGCEVGFLVGEIHWIGGCSHTGWLHSFIVKADVGAVGRAPVAVVEIPVGVEIPASYARNRVGDQVTIKPW